MMDKMPVSAIIFQSIPESIILLSFGIAIVGEKINFKKTFIASLISSFSSMIVRYFALHFGIHSIIGVLVLFILFWKYLGLKAWKALFSSLFSLSVLMLLEITITQSILNYNNITLTEVLHDKFKRIIYTYPHLAIFGIITWIVYRKKVFLLRGSRINEK